VAEWAIGRRWRVSPGEVVVIELEEGQRAPIAEPIQGVAVRLFAFTHQWSGFGPRCEQRKADDVLVERSRRVLITCDPGVVVDPLR
jgi:hypothetical protein